ncbi:MAG: DASS family sodium-coupled anion symporter [Prevotellaceae bacterium]|jgi:anion transporter|nr:DASS family sodium-coupled anion symporter [Prevotellaceae bacterium]
MEQITNKDPLDMNNYRIEQLPQRPKSGFEKWMSYIGAPLAIIAFILIYWGIDISFLNNLNTEQLTDDALKRFNDLGLQEFSRINYAMLAIFAAAIILWITEAVPNYLTSLFVIIAIVITGVTSEKTAYAQLGHPVMWLNILSFVLASMLVKTQVAKRFALWFVVHFGKNATWIFFSFIVINIVLSAFISATTAKAAILLPIFMVIAAIYGATGGNSKNNFGRNIVLQNLFQINIGASGFMTGSGANLLAVSLIVGAGATLGYQEWFVAAFPLCLLLIIIGWFVGTKIMFPIKKEEQVPQIEGGMQRLKDELQKMGTMKTDEYKAIAIFLGVLFLWATKGIIHNVSETAVAFLGAVVALTPFKIGIVKWNDIDIPWHLMIFSAGAYTLGAGIDATNIAGTLVDSAFSSLGISNDTPFWMLFAILTGTMMFSALLFQSKTMRVLIFIPIAIGVAQKFGYSVMSLAFPLALLTEHVYVLPFNSKPAALLYTTDQYSWADTFKYGITMMIISWLLLFVWGETVLHWLGHLPNGVF